MESIMSLPENRLPDLEIIPDIAHPDIFLNIPSLKSHSSNHKERRSSHSTFEGGKTNCLLTNTIWWTPLFILLMILYSNFCVNVLCNLHFIIFH